MNCVKLSIVLSAICVSLVGCGGGGNGGSETTKPTVVLTSISNGSTYVPRDIQEIEVVFSEQMNGGWSLNSSTSVWPLSNSTATRWATSSSIFYVSRDNTASLLPANSTIDITLNKNGGNQYFRDKSSNVLDTYIISFTTANGSISNYSAGENGTKSSPWGDGSSTQKPAMAVKFTPASYPVTIRSVTLYTSNNSGSEQLFNLYGYDGNLASETQIFSPVQNQNIPNNGTACVARTISIPATTITSGSFHIAVEWLTKPLNSVSGNNAFFLCTDSTLNNLNSSFYRHSGTTWSSLETISSTGGDLGIVVNY